ncbi:hypothetical protein F0562_005482 [Nyssa sinensis]|uniref:AP2/ERF domain-containing protein n=1 Tax=Nyssa sinensis TaxID=561372 RepID=A0A5J5AJD8_9ASTE|nr:hypothetical protein F0562_005482 [Nyssa sinensis]
MDMLSSSSESQMLQSPMKLAPFDGSSSDSQHYYFVDNFYANGWTNPRAQAVYTEDNQVKEVTGQNIGDSSIFTSFIDSEIQHQTTPKLEDFLSGDSTSLVRYSDSQTETQDSSLTHIYEQSASAYFNDHQDFKTIAATAGFQAFSTNSGSEVDDSASVARTRLACGEFAVDSESCKKITDTFGQRTSIYRGVTRHRWTGRYEAHLWDNSCRREGQARKGRQVYLGGYDKEEKAARSYDLAALKYWGPTATTNFPVSNYSKELEEMKHVTKQEFIASLRRKSSGFSRGASIYRGVTRHHQQGRWQARIGRVAGNKDLYLGTFAKRLKLSLEAEQKLALNHDQKTHCNSNSSSSISFAAIQPVSAIPCGVPFDTAHAPMLYHNSLYHHLHTSNVGTSDTSGPASSIASPMTLLPSPAEFFIWPHQSY